jgi:hypothetical protein
MRAIASQCGQDLVLEIGEVRDDAFRAFRPLQLFRGPVAEPLARVIAPDD